MSHHQRARVHMTPQIQDEILIRIGEGESLLRICGPDRDAGMPDRVTVHRRLNEDRAFRQAYLTARKVQAANIADEILEIADGRAPEAGQASSVGRDWLRVSARQWLAGVMAPRTYSARRALQDELEETEAKAVEADRQEEARAREAAKREREAEESRALLARIQAEYAENGWDDEEEEE